MKLKPVCVISHVTVPTPLSLNQIYSNIEMSNSVVLFKISFSLLLLLSKYSMEVESTLIIILFELFILECSFSLSNNSGSRTNTGVPNVGVDKRRSVQILIQLSISIQIRLG